MTISMYKTSVPIFVQFLSSLSAVLDKAAAHAELRQYGSEHSGAQGPHRQDDRLPQGPQTRADRRYRGQGDQDHVSERGDARLHRAIAAADELAAQFLFPLHHRLR